MLINLNRDFVMSKLQPINDQLEFIDFKPRKKNNEASLRSALILLSS
jgi:hypothetical protein